MAQGDWSLMFSRVLLFKVCPSDHICITWTLLEMQALRPHPRLTESEISFLRESKNFEYSLQFRSTALDLGKKFIISYYPSILDHTARHGSKTLTLPPWDQCCNWFHFQEVQMSREKGKTNKRPPRKTWAQYNVWWFCSNYANKGRTTLHVLPIDNLLWFFPPLLTSLKWTTRHSTGPDATTALWKMYT